MKHDARITLDLKEWIKSVQFEVDGGNLKIIRNIETPKNMSVKTKRTSTSNYESYDPPLTQPNEAPRPMPKNGAPEL